MPDLTFQDIALGFLLLVVYITANMWRLFRP
jgi:hypothetical protein